MKKKVVCGLAPATILHNPFNYFNDLEKFLRCGPECTQPSIAFMRKVEIIELWTLSYPDFTGAKSTRTQYLYKVKGKGKPARAAARAACRGPQTRQRGQPIKKSDEHNESTSSNGRFFQVLSTISPVNRFA